MNVEVVHRLGTVLAGGYAAAQMFREARSALRARTVRQRGTRLLAAPGDGGEGRRARRRGALPRPGGGRGRRLRDWAPPAGVGLAGLVLLGGLPGCLVGPAAAYGVRLWIRRRSLAAEAAGPPEAGAVRRQLPLAADLLAACLAAGAGPLGAAEAVGGSLGGPVGGRLVQVAAELRLGAEPSAAWNRLGELPGAYGLARALERAQASGAPAVEQVGRVAADCRAEQARAAAAAARRAGVLATVPLGLCFLPAFLVVGVAPVLIGLAGGLLATG